ncbi:MAG: M3 family oligoendopeptidase, partial [candidate division Zixibacteria bacterium]|nr:M3 family oligoendopeptidase [candidate division Zixibacteria bacterium]
NIYDDIRQSSSFIGCVISENVNDEEGHRLDSEIDGYSAEWQQLMTRLEDFALKLPDAEWASFIGVAKLDSIRFFLDEMRDKAKAKMAPELERLALSLAVDGYHAWNRIYDKMAGDLRVDFEENGQTKTISMGQLAAKMDLPDRKIRQQAFEKMTSAWQSRAELAAMTLNSLAGFRLALYKNRGWESPIFEALRNARIKQETLDAMWGVVADESPRLQKYIAAKKNILGIDQFKWYDQTAPVGKTSMKFSYQEAGDFIVKHISKLSVEMGEFSRRALDKRWVEAEDRPGKAAGGFCTGFPLSKESRIFMTFTGTFGGLSTLAHELGHAYHSFVLNDKPSFVSRYPMTLAETASTFNELAVTDAAMEAADNPQEKLMLLDQKIANAYIMMCNIRARFIFDKTFYAERKKGFVPRSRLDELMVNAQKEAYAGTIEGEGWHPLFWASKLHFFISGVPFYNFPYTFGFLFANGIYDRALKDGASFAGHYRNLLADTGSMMTEEVARKHLGVDLTKEDFWRDSVNRVLADIDPFVELAGKLK